MTTAPQSTGGLEDFAEITADASAFLNMPILVACPMNRRGMMTNKMATRFGGLLGRAVSKKVAKERAGGLPEHFIVAITADEAIVVEYKLAGRGRKLIGEIERWPRAGLGVDWSKVGPYMLHVTITVPGEDPLNLGAGDAPCTHAFLTFLADANAVLA
jgi:hypothetical protein